MRTKLVEDIVRVLHDEVNDEDRRRSIYLELIPVFIEHEVDDLEEALGYDDSYDEAYEEAIV